MARIFISYRRDDSATITDRISERLEQAFGRKEIFRDLYAIAPGTNFRHKMTDAASSTVLMLVIIGPQWASITNNRGRKRLDIDDDPVRVEVETGLRTSSVTVVPILVHNTSMPTKKELPTTLQEIADLNAMTVRDDPDFDNDIKQLEDFIRKTLPKSPLGVRKITNLAIIIIGLIASLIGVYSFSTGNSSLRDSHDRDDGKENSPSQTSTSISVLMPDQTQSAELDPAANPHYGSTTMSEFSWSEWSPDYFTISVNGEDIPSANNVYVDFTDPESNEHCTGYTTREPISQVYWYKQHISEIARLRVFYIGFETDTSLLISHPEGTWSCNNNYIDYDSNYYEDSETTHPQIDIELPRTGMHSIWILTPEPLDDFSGTIYFTLADYSPYHYNPTLTRSFVFIGQGSTFSGAEFVFIECKLTQAGAEISTDVIVDSLEGNEQIRLMVEEGTNSWYSEPFRVVRPGIAAFDFSPRGVGTMQLIITPSNQFKYFGIDLTLQIKSSSGQWETITEPYRATCGT